MTAPIVVKQGKLALSQTGGKGSVFVRDVAVGSDFVQLEGKLTPGPEGCYEYQASDQKMQLALSATYRMVGEAVRVDGTLRDLSGRDRAISVYFSYPVEAVGWKWYQDQRVAQPIEAGKKYHNLVQTGAGANGLASRYPLACVASDTDSLAIAAPLDVPRLCRLGYDAGSKELYAAVDLGLSSVTEKFPSSASFSLLLYRPGAGLGVPFGPGAVLSAQPAELHQAQHQGGHLDAVHAHLQRGRLRGLRVPVQGGKRRGAVRCGARHLQLRVRGALELLAEHAARRPNARRRRRWRWWRRRRRRGSPRRKRR